MKKYLCVAAAVEAPLHVAQILAFGFADAEGVLRVEADFAVLVHDLRMDGENHVLLKSDVAGRADGGILQHGGADGVAGEVAEGKSVAGENVGDGAMDIAGQLALAQPQA